MRSMRFGLLLIGLVAAGCNSGTTSNDLFDTTSPTTPTTVSFTLSVTGERVLTGLRQRSQLTATSRTDDGTVTDVTKSAIWTSTKTSIAVVSTSGVVTTVGRGEVAFIGTYQGRTETHNLTVEPITSTVLGTVTGSDNANGTFALTINGSVARTTAATSAEVSGSVQIPGRAMTVTGFYSSATGDLTFASAQLPYRFTGTIAAGVLTGTFTFDQVTGVIRSTSIAQR